MREDAALPFDIRQCVPRLISPTNVSGKKKTFVNRAHYATQILIVTDKQNRGVPRFHSIINSFITGHYWMLLEVGLSFYDLHINEAVRFE